MTDWTVGVVTFETSDTNGASLGVHTVTVDISLEHYPAIVSSHTFTVTYLHVCERTVLSLTGGALQDVEVIANAGGVTKNVGSQTNSEAEANSDQILCGNPSYSSVSLSIDPNDYPTSIAVNMASGDLVVADPGAG